MKKILLFAGTTEGRRLSECLSASRIPHTLCVATEYGEVVLKQSEYALVHRGRMNQEEIKLFLQQGDYLAVVDATHPYAEAVTENIKNAMEGMELPYFRLLRSTSLYPEYEDIHSFSDCESCAKALEQTEGNILLTTGSKELKAFCRKEAVKNRLYVRVLPGVESVMLCEAQGIRGKQILALQGPFSTEMNEAILRQYGIKCLVTKRSGKAGGYEEKIEAAKRLNIPVYVIDPKPQQGEDFETVCSSLETLTGSRIQIPGKMRILLAGVGMGNRHNLTVEVQQAIEEADILLGAERMLEGLKPRIEKRPYYTSSQILPYLQEIQEKTSGYEQLQVVILFSGDSGFYSGCSALYKSLQEEIKTGKLKAILSVLPGISSVSYLASCLGESYQDALILSIHGKAVPNLAGKIKTHEKTYLLLSGAADVRWLGKRLLEAGLEHCQVVTGYKLSYPEQSIKTLSPGECCEVWEEGLYSCLIRNEKAEAEAVTCGKADEEFIRDKVPMTKEEVREVSICKLRLKKDSVVYDIGSGTGSIAMEIGELSDEIRVYAIEQKAEAVELIQKNKAEFGLENVEIIQVKAPDGLLELPTPTHAFIGGSGGNLKAILQTLYRKNPAMRVVINAISMETIAEIREALELLPITQEAILQMQVNRSRVMGGYHLMQAENPVWICSFCFREEENK